MPSTVHGWSGGLQDRVAPLAQPSSPPVLALIS